MIKRFPDSFYGRAFWNDLLARSAAQLANFNFLPEVITANKAR